MAYTSVGDASLSISGVEVMIAHLRSTAEKSRFRNYEFRQFGTHTIQPAYSGRTVYIPVFESTDGAEATAGAYGNKSAESERGQGTIANTAEGATFSPRAFAFQSRQGTIDRYEDGFGISKEFAATATLRRYLERGAQFLNVGLAQTEEDLIQEALFWKSGQYGVELKDGTTAGEEFILVEFDGDTDGTWGLLAASEAIVPEALAVARKELRVRNNPGFEQLDGKYAAILSPRQVYNLITNVSTNQLRFEQDSMNMTGNFRNNVIGDLFGIRVFESSNVPSGAGTVTDDPITGEVAWELGCVLAPDAFYVVEHETLNPQLYYEGFDTGGVANPTHNRATLAMDYMTGAFAGDCANKLVVIPTLNT